MHACHRRLTWVRFGKCISVQQVSEKEEKQSQVDFENAWYDVMGNSPAFWNLEVTLNMASSFVVGLLILRGVVTNVELIIQKV